MWQLSGGRLLGIGLESLAQNAGELYARWLRSRRIRQRSTPIRELAAGMICKVTGVVEAPTPEVSPFTQTACAYFVVRLEQRKVSEDRGFEESVWEPQLQVGSRATFWLEGEDGGKVLVDPNGALSDLPTALVSEHPRVNDENPTLASFLRAQGVLSTMYMGISGDFRFFESTIAAGSMVSVVGTVREERGVTTSGYRDTSASFACIGSAPTRPMHFVPVAP